MKLFVVVISLALLGGALGAQFKLNGCIMMNITATLTVKASSSNQTATLSVDEPNIGTSGQCGNSSNAAVLTLTFPPPQQLSWTLTFTEADPVTLTQRVRFVPNEIFNSSESNDTVTANGQASVTLSASNSSFQCLAPQTFAFQAANDSDGVTYTISLAFSDFKVQAFNLDNDTYSPSEECREDISTVAPTTEPPSDTTTNSTTEEPSNATTTEPTTATTATTQPSPTTLAPTTPLPTENTFTVKSASGNVTCIVFKADITFGNFTYTMNNNKTRTVSNIAVPIKNGTNVMVSGDCGDANSTTQSLRVTFNGNWNLTLTFARGADSASSLLTATADEYSLRDVVLVYSLSPQFFPNVSNITTGQIRTASRMNLTDFLKGAQQGSYKCDAELTETLSDGVLFETTNLQYKAFNANNDTAFNNVSECPGDDESNSIVPIAVGAALAGLVVIVLIAYLIGRRRSRRTGYESV